MPGGGVALYQAAKVLQSNCLDEFVEDKSELVGVRILAEALQQPIRLVIENKTGKSAAYTIEKIENEGSIFAGYDAKNEQICDMVEEGIVDSQQVV